MALHKVKVQPLTKEAFGPYGEMFEIPTENPGKVSDRYNFWPKLATMAVNSGELQFGISTFFKRPFRLDKMERHYKSEEFMTPLTGPIIIPFAKHVGMTDDEIPDFDKVDAFLIKPTQSVIVKTGVWHWTPMPVEGTTSIICVFETGTEKTDVIIRPFPVGEIVELVL